MRQQISAADPTVASAVADLRRRADSQLKTGPFSVIDKTLLAPSGDKHDYSTLGRYYWPNPKTPDGMPWIRQDGKTNPDYFNGKIGDSERFVHLCDAVVPLARASYLLGDEKYADRAAFLLRTWFIDPATRMNPNARYGARFPGNWDGQCYGVHGTRQLMDLCDAIELLKTSTTWTTADQAAMVDWCKQYLDWLTQSDLGKQEEGQKNNHGTAWDCLAARLALFTGQAQMAHDIVEQAKTKRIASQIDPDGKLPLELARATPWEYERYTLEFFFKLSTIGDRVGIDLWNYHSDDGRCIRLAFDYLMHQVIPNNSSVDPAILEKVGRDRIGPMLQVAAQVYSDPKYLEMMKQIGFSGDLSFAEASVNGHLSR